MNALAASVHWNQLEPEEGCFDFSQIDLLIKGARAHGMHLILLWFGSWKNGTSQYIPTWMKLQTTRFVRAETVMHQKLMVLSPHCKENLSAECTAFRRLLEHIKETDADQTVIGIQVENEAGLLGVPRDYSPDGEKAYSAPVPSGLIERLQNFGGRDDPLLKIWENNGSKTEGTWESLFGNDSAEACTAYAMAVYMNELAKAGKQILDLPFYTNVWLGEMYNRVPGIDYPSGGAVTKMLGLWKQFAPALDALCPDIYVKDFLTFEKVSSAYAREDNPFYIPETGLSALGTVNLVRGIVTKGLCGALGFGLEHMTDEAGNIKENCAEFVHFTRIIRAAEPLILKHQGTEKLYAVTQYEGSAAEYYDFGDFIGRAVFVNPLEDEYADGSRPYMDFLHDSEECYKVRAKGFIVYEGKGSFYLAGEGFRLNLIRKDSIELMTTGSRVSNFQNLRHQEYLEVSEGKIDSLGNYIPLRMRTGDETDHGIWVHYDTGVVHARIQCEETVDNQQ